MKRGAFAIVFLGMALIALPQSLDKGGFAIGGYSSLHVAGGSYGFDYEDEIYIDPDDVKTFSAGAAFWAGYFIADGLEIGVEADVSYYKRRYSNDYPNDEFKSTQLLIGPQAGYFFSSRSALTPFAQLTAFHSHRIDRIDGAKDDEDKGFGFRARAGVVYFVTTSVGVSGTAFYEFERIEDVDSDPKFDFIDRDYGLELGLVITLS